ncbi:cytochrome c maturation protein CcmE [Rhodoligotrophos defluvii]|uniref:cytochrome c maturation protein CcmE n=1 Tax=Rhodoligotrophos defluvii TaxID=2561934 RepID=UPI0010C9B798|nr:cytochrome c maturation protein CcmE [Rhodoligotrophos defluvii]
MALSRKQRRGAFILTGIAILGLAVGLVLFALSDTIVFFYTPSEAAEKVQPGQRFRLGGLVAAGSVQRMPDGRVHFTVTDQQHTMTVSYAGILPDLFREGQGVVAEGVLDGHGAFIADTVLAKHDENYMPREVADALKRKGVWQHNEAKSE